MPTTDEQLARLTQQIEQAQAKKRKLLARQRAAEQKAKRSADTRRKILIGALVLSKLDDPEHGARFRTFLQRELHAFLTREDDRALFADLLEAAQDRQGTEDARP